MSHQLDPDDIPFDLPPRNEFYLSVWSESAIGKPERKVTYILCWLLAATLALGIVGGAFLWGIS